MRHVGMFFIPSLLSATSLTRTPQDATATTYSVTCSSTASCALPTNFMLTQGPSMVHYAYSHTATADSDPSGTIEVGCAITDSASGSCSKTISAQLGTITSAVQTAATTFADCSALGAQKVVVTAGDLVVSTIASSTTASSTASITSTTSEEKVQATTYAALNSTISSTGYSNTTMTSSPSTTVGASTTAAVVLTSAGSTTVAASTSSAGAMPMITANAQWFIGGAAAVAAMIVL